MHGLEDGRRGAMPKVMTDCPVTGHPIGTHAAMTADQLRRLKAALAVYCPLCKRPHLAAPDRLWLEDRSSETALGDVSPRLAALGGLRAWVARLKSDVARS